MSRLLPNLSVPSMKRTAFVFLSLFTVALVQAQVTQNFSTNPATSQPCFINSGFTYSTNGGSGSGSGSASEVTSNASANILATPYIDFTAGTTTVSAFYKVSGSFNGGVNANKTSKIEIGIVDKNGVFTVLNGASGQTFTSASTGTVSGTVTTTGTYRVQVRVTIGNSSVTTNIDDIATSAGQYHYGALNPCNQAPTQKDDVFTAPNVTATVSGNVLTNTDPNGADSDPNSEVLSVVPQNNVTLAEGTLNLAANGDFTFLPNSTFKGGPVTFSYTLTDNGFDPLTSAATVTINYPSAPTANNDRYNSPTLAGDLSGNVLSNDTDPNTGVPFNASAPTATLVSGPVYGGTNIPAQGDFTFDENGNFTFHPTNGFTGDDVVFTYKITDNTYSPYFSNTATVTLNYPIGATLPVNFISFKAHKAVSGTQLNWKVAQQVNVKGYEVERSNGVQFTRIGFVAAGEGQESYTFTDVQPATGTVLYRIKNVDHDGAYKYSAIISVKNGTSAVVLKAFPIPAQNNITLQHNEAGNGAFISLAAQDGRVVKTLRPTAGNMQTEISLSGLPAGMYMVRYDNGNGQVETLKLIKR